MYTLGKLEQLRHEYIFPSARFAPDMVISGAMRQTAAGCDCLASPPAPGNAGISEVSLQRVALVACSREDTDLSRSCSNEHPGAALEFWFYLCSAILVHVGLLGKQRKILCICGNVDMNQWFPSLVNFCL